MLITKGDAMDGSVILVHSDDDELNNQRVIYVPPVNHKPRSKRAVYNYVCPYRRLVSKSRGPRKGQSLFFMPDTASSFKDAVGS